ncbi:pitrilysin family protein, partial [Iodobacter sp. LRB]|uniref:M16 family metallopeptidase n=1 Tax=Iodobacter sp. LRB TaxID=3127955 RepID=UPI00307DE4DF
MIKLLAVLFFFMVEVSASADSQVYDFPRLSADIRHGVLANGLHYFIKPNGEPKGQVELRLLVNAGSMSEADDERGVAHLLEHMAFRRTKHFRQGQVKAFLESEGMRLGADSNAFTHHEYTLYQLASAKEGVPQALQLLADWAAGIEFDPEELALERDVVLNEERQVGYSAIVQKNLLEALYPQSNYAARLPIGVSDIVKNIPLYKIKNFYSREYQAQRMTLIVVGDVNPEFLDTKIKELFSGIAKGDFPVNYPLPSAAQELRTFNHFVDGLTLPVVRLSWIIPPAVGDDSNTTLREFHQDIIAIALLQRLIKHASKDNSFLSNPVMNSIFPVLVSRQIEFGFMAEVKGTKVESALSEIYREIERAKHFGFTQDEINTAFKIRQVKIKNLDHKAWAELLFRHVRYGEPVQNLSESTMQLNQFFAALHPADLQAELLHLMAMPEQSVLLLSPSSVKGLPLLNKQSVLDIKNKVQAEKFENLQSILVNELIKIKSPVPGEILSRNIDEITGGTVWRLANGIEVLTIPPKSNLEKIGYSARANGGMTALKKNQLSSGLILKQYLQNAGLGDINYTDLQQDIVEHSLKVIPFINVDQHGFSAVAEQNSLETLLRIHYKLFTSFSKNEKALENS